LDVVHGIRGVGSRALHDLRAGEGAAMERDAQIALVVAGAAGHVRLAGSNRNGQGRERQLLSAAAQGKQHIGRGLVDEDLIPAGGLEHRTTLAERVGAAQDAQRVDHVGRQRAHPGILSNQPAERIAPEIGVVAAKAGAAGSGQLAGRVGLCQSRLGAAQRVCQLGDLSERLLIL
jgi:hypothetical protein